MATPVMNFVPTSFVPVPKDVLTASLIAGTKWGLELGHGVNLTYSIPSGIAFAIFPYSFDNEWGFNNPNINWYALSNDQTAAFINALGSWSNVANLGFTKVADNESTVGEIRIALSDAVFFDPKAAAWAYLPSGHPSAGDIWLDPVVFSPVSSTAPGTFNFHTLVHEIGHALGLKHPHEGLGFNPAVLPQGWDSVFFTIMSYEPNASGFILDRYPDTPMILDIQAIQYLYGANTAFNSGNTIYTFSDGGKYFETIWDGGGTDTIVYTGTSGGIIDLTEGEWSALGLPVNVFNSAGQLVEQDPRTVWIAYGTTIENAIGNNGSDLIIGNSAGNDLNGNAGDDTLIGGAGDDFLFGGQDNDELIGGNGSDTLIGAFGDDELRGAQGDDELRGAQGHDVIFGGSGDDFLFGGKDNDHLNGNQDNDTLIGAFGDDVLVGDVGNDELRGAQGRDNVFGDSGNDFLVGGTGDDYLFGGPDNDFLDGGDDNDTLIGALGDDELHGGAGDDELRGAQGDDVVIGGDGVDNMFGGKGDDVLAGGAENDSLQGGFGDDILEGGAGDDELRGAQDNDVVTDVGGGDDTLFGGEGDDFLLGFTGDDVMTGGSGDDVFVFNTALGVTNEDTITDFIAADDQILLALSVFSALGGAGLLTAAEFKANAAGVADETDDRIVYNTTTGELFYDADGSGEGIAVKFAELTGAPVIASGDFEVI